MLITYPSFATALASQQARGMPAWPLRELWLGGEQLSSAQRTLLKDRLCCTLRNSYGASEFHSIAYACAQGWLHLNDDWVILEGIDAQGRVVAPGEFSHTTLLTNLANHVQPLLPCPAGLLFDPGRGAPAREPGGGKLRRVIDLGAGP